MVYALCRCLPLRSVGCLRYLTAEVLAQSEYIHTSLSFSLRSLIPIPMSLSPQSIEQYRKLYQQRFGIILDLPEAEEQAQRLLAVMRISMRQWQNDAFDSQDD